MLKRLLEPPSTEVDVKPSPENDVKPNDSLLYLQNHVQIEEPETKNHTVNVKEETGAQVPLPGADIGVLMMQFPGFLADGGIHSIKQELSLGDGAILMTQQPLSVADSGILITKQPMSFTDSGILLGQASPSAAYSAASATVIHSAPLITSSGEQVKLEEAPAERVPVSEQPVPHSDHAEPSGSDGAANQSQPSDDQRSEHADSPVDLDLPAEDGNDSVSNDESRTNVQTQGEDNDKTADKSTNAHHNDMDIKTQEIGSDFEPEPGSNTKKIFCKICNKTFNRTNGSKDHKKTHNVDPCNVRGKQFAERKRLVGDKHSEKRVKCQINDTDVSLTSVKMHMKKSHEWPYSSTVGEKSPRSKKNPLQQKHVAVKLGPIECKICDKKLKDLPILRKHMLTHSGEKKYACEVCGKSFLHRCDMKSHMIVHTRDKPYVCNVCDERFRCLSTFRKHQATHMKDHPYSCPTCSKGFLARGLLNKHVKAHLAGKQLCSKCGKGFRHSKGLEEHMLTHTEVIINVQPQGEKSSDLTEKSTNAPHKDANNEAQVTCNNLDPATGSIKKKIFCEICGKTFNRPNGLKAHKKTHDVDPCDVCGKQFINRKVMDRHKDSHVRVKCPICDKDLGLKSLKSHIKQCHEKPYFCTICEKNCGSKAKLLRHTHNPKRQEGPFLCEICNKKLQDIFTLRKHMITHYGEKKYACDVCGKRFLERNQVKKHMPVHTREKPYVCNICDQSFRWLETFRNHQATHMKELPYSCPTCGKSYLTKTTFNKHVKGHLPGEKLCNECGKVYSYKTLKKHLLTHTGERKYLCDTCGKSFSTIQYLKSHAAFHTGERPFSCKLCDSKFRYLTNLYQHMNKHTQYRPYCCVVCNKAFPTKPKLLIHNETHRDQEMLICAYCGSEFLTKTKLIVHIQEHMQENPKP